jgi:dipeptidyl-peptidase-4
MGTLQKLAVPLSTLLLTGCIGESAADNDVTADLPLATEVEAVTSIDRLYSQPSIIGTSPEGAVWSPDGSTLAFLCNSEGRSFRDVWVYSTEDAAERRLTTHAEEQSADSEHDGISEVVWLGGDRLAYILDGAPYLLTDNGDSERLTEARQVVHGLRASRTGDQLAYLAAGGLYVRKSSSGSSPRVLLDPGDERVSVERYEW